ncbi:MAG TPA: orotidine-5'-phosphate decarboxylase [bacterium]|nr:orotidine-5'-phosphate decarboxylase [bacterium]
MPDAPQLIVALDTPEAAALERLVDDLAGLPVLFKSHWISFPSLGFEGLRRVVDKTGDRLFLDFKLHDIPNTVKHAIRSLLPRVPFRLLTLHAAGGPAMIQAARLEVDRYTEATAGAGMAAAPKLIAITLLTSVGEPELTAVGFPWKSREDGVLHLARLAYDNGAHGVVCSPQEAPRLRREFGPDLLLVCPGIRLEGDDAADHANTATPAEARDLGADYIVVGRPIYTAHHPVKVAADILRQLGRQPVH